ncbi:MAG: competence/damage-inducible protein A [Flavobacteriia bacterium]|nr:competence/damage-inducible protein A [Flavobacteriia bacterium]
MIAEIISIGDELLIGKTLNTNASWIGMQLSLIGVSVKNVQTVSDESYAITDALSIAEKRSDIVIITGGLGPTKDDITKQVLCNYFDTKLEINLDVLKQVESFFIKRKKPLLEVNVQQAAVPIKSIVLPNTIGTAPGMLLEKNKTIFISLPGVPYEMKEIFTKEVLPLLTKKYQLKSIYHLTANTTGIGESYLAELIKDWEDNIRKDGFSLAYLPSPGMVKLRITSPNGEIDKIKIQQYFLDLEHRIPDNFFSYEDDSLSTVIGKKLITQNKTLSTVESCTGGGIASTIVDTPGSSRYYMGSIVAYSYELKSLLVEVNPETIITKGAVSEETAIEMALGGLKKMNTDYCIATTGIAGPDGGTPDKPVGLVWIAIASNERVLAKKFIFGDNRERNRQMTSLAALNLLRTAFLKE